MELVNREDRSRAGGPAFKAHLPKTAGKENRLSQVVTQCACEQPGI